MIGLPAGWARSEFQALPPLLPMESLSTQTEEGQTPDISLLIPARGAAHSLETTVREAHAFLSRAFPDSFEIILIPNPGPQSLETDRSIQISEDLSKRFSRIKSRTHLSPQGKGAALRSGFLASSGRIVCFTDADLPYDLGFFETAASQIRSGFDFVTGNRRLDTSQFDVPVELLRLAYGRHRLGLAFNRVVRWLLPIPTTDTQAGIKAMSRRLAQEAFSRQVCPGFFFDLEFFLTAAGLGYRHSELPVTLYLNTEKSTVRVIRESALAGFWLSRITLRNLFKKAYGAMKTTSPLTRYRNTSPGTRAFLEARWRLTPYAAMAAKLPPRGRILDLGCGHGLFSLALALGSPECEVIGLDHDEARLKTARAAGEGIPNLKYASGTLSDPHPTAGAVSMTSAPTSGDATGISMIDVMHYLPYSEQERLFAEAFRLLAPGGVLIVREVEPGSGPASTFNRFYERMATATGFTRSEKKTELHFRGREEWEEVLRQQGFEVTSEPCSHFLFADILFVARKPVLASNGTSR